MPRAKQRTPELRDHLLEVAITTLSEEGIARFTTRRVAERAGTSVPAVYELFDDKAGLVRAMFFEGFRLLGAELAKVPVDGRSAGRLGAAGAGVPVVLPGVPEAGAGDVLAAVCRFRAGGRGAGGGRVGAGGIRRPDSAVHRRGALLGGSNRHRTRIARSRTGFGSARGGTLAGFGTVDRAAVEVGRVVTAQRVSRLLILDPRGLDFFGPLSTPDNHLVKLSQHSRRTVGVCGPGTVRSDPVDSPAFRKRHGSD